MDKILTFKEIYDRFSGKKLYERKIVGDEIKTVPTRDCLELQLILGKQGNLDEHGRSISSYFCLELKK